MIATVFCLLSVDAKDPSIEYKWFNVGMLDYDAEKQQYLVQKINNKGRIINKETGEPVVNGGIQSDGTRLNYICICFFEIFLFIIRNNLEKKI